MPAGGGVQFAAVMGRRLISRLHGRAWRAWVNRRVGASRFGAFGADSAFVPPAVVSAPERVFIGDRVFFQTGAWLAVYDEVHGVRFDPRLTIGDGCTFGRDVVIACLGEVTFGREVQVADRIFVGDTYHGYQDPDTNIVRQPMAEPRPVRIGDGAFLGINCVILPGVTVGERAFVGAGAVVTKDVPANSVVVGNPARVVRVYDRERGEWVRPGGA